jgi:DNA-binding LacI/PurR family transcriptional regulator
VATTIHDVAHAAGVSVATVSRVFTRPSTVRDETRERVLSAAGGLGYQPNRAARGLITGKTGNIGLVVPDLGNPYFHAVLKGAQARAHEADYAVFISDSQEQAHEEAALIQAMGKQVDGIVLCSPRMSPKRLAASAATPPLVLLGRAVPGLSSVTHDSADGMRQAVAHLAGLGHRRVAFVSGPRNSWSNRQRHKGLAAASRAAGVETVVFGPTPPQFEGGSEVAERVLAAGVTAVLAYNDLIAVGLLHRLGELGVAVPDEISVVGFDDIPFAAMTSPPLTTVAMPTELAGRAAVTLMLDRLAAGPDAPRGDVRTLPVALVVRGSTAPPAGAEQGRASPAPVVVVVAAAGART